MYSYYDCVCHTSIEEYIVLDANVIENVLNIYDSTNMLINDKEFSQDFEVENVSMQKYIF